MTEIKQDRILNEKDTPIWAYRINKEMHEQGINQKKLAKLCGYTPAAVSKWIGYNRKKNSYCKPKREVFELIASALSVSVRYLEGEDECKTPDDEAIHKVIGLSGKAIENMKSIQKQHNDISMAKKLEILSFLAETINESSLLENLYNYLLGRFSFPGKEASQGAAYMLEFLPNGEMGRNLAFKDVFSQACFVLVQEDLTRLKDVTQRQREAGEKAAYLAQAGKETP